MLKTVEEIRRIRLKMLLEEVGSFAALNRRTDKTATDATYSQIFNAAPDSKTGRPREMGSALARSIEEKLGLERGLMDNDPDLLSAAWPFKQISADRWNSYDEEQRIAWERWLLRQMDAYDSPPQEVKPKSTDTDA